jgi:hypothetical protein
MIANNTPGWEDELPKGIAELIKQKDLFQNKAAALKA